MQPVWSSLHRRSVGSLWGELHISLVSTTYKTSFLLICTGFGFVGRRVLDRHHMVWVSVIPVLGG